MSLSFLFHFSDSFQVDFNMYCFFYVAIYL